MKKQSDNDELLAELDQIERLISTISERSFSFVVQTLTKRHTEILGILELQTSPSRRTLKEILDSKLRRGAATQTKY